MTRPRTWRLFTRAEAIALRRCLDCCWHPPTQGHRPRCPAAPTGGPAARDHLQKGRTR